MRAILRTRAAQLTAATGLALAVSATAFASAAAAADPTPTPTTTTTPAATEPVAESGTKPVQKPATKPATKAVQESLDASVAITARYLAGPPKAGLATIRVRSTKPTKSYQLIFDTPYDLDAHALNHPGWDCDLNEEGGISRLTCDYTGAPTAAPADVSMAFEMPQQAGRSYGLAASVKTTEPDSKPANNAAKATIVVPRDKPVPPPATGTISGKVWHDVNANGRQDKGEKGIAGARVVVNTAVGTQSKVVGKATTAADGRYTFTKLPAGTGKYGVAVAAPGKSWSFTGVNLGTDTADSDFRRVTDASFNSYFGKNAVVGIHDRTDVVGGRTTVLDAGLVRQGGGGKDGNDNNTDDDTLPVTGAGTAGLLGAGALLLAGGAALTLAARRRRTA